MVAAVLFEKAGATATITLNRPDKPNALRGGMVRRMDEALRSANRDDDVRVIILEGAGDSFCAGADFSGGLEHTPVYKEDGYDPGKDVYAAMNTYTSAFPMFMGLWRGLKPTIAKVHGARCEASEDSAHTARDDEADRQSGIRQHGPAKHADARADSRRRDAQHTGSASIRAHGARSGCAGCVAERDAPFGDYSRAPDDEQPRMRSHLS